ncbi:MULTISPECIES: class I SAM-dependent methyltransferase [unclassified Brenneria]|uniref:class I SAM-dependent DNA methyltransferase n=1 Tax=unclassified Brenneria TaxID=2634434 RepID=UPI0029C4F948|nr:MULTISPECIES: class I SAM-dependent methyltransferase [unclassified Brenneria]MDX5629365.1 class I SAM-dependent methyltransferase [Brenneria sp. L3-3Z]MDX5696472.1 class I SAM-dependent methyltransferase [Brenneria sp. L4-2C]MEE3663039.1 class I SAM-dependent methyltransferase [Brenneria sp. g21c3]
MQDSAKTRYDSFAEFYDSWHDRWPANAKAYCVDTLAELANDQPVLELGVGTGRIALPLSLKGLHVSGVDNSIKMLDKLRAKPGGDRISTVCANFADVPVDGPFGLIYVVLSFGYLLTQEEQLGCFINASKKLTEDGSFVIQTVIPKSSIFNGAGSIDDLFDVPSTDDAETVMLLGSKTNLERQVIDQRVIVLNETGTQVYSHKLRYVWPSELDLMARIAGLKLHARWSNWRREPFTSQSPSQISVYKHG